MPNCLTHVLDAFMCDKYGFINSLLVPHGSSPLAQVIRMLVEAHRSHTIDVLLACVFLQLPLSKIGIHCTTKSLWETVHLFHKSVLCKKTLQIDDMFEIVLIIDCLICDLAINYPYIASFTLLPLTMRHKYRF